MNSLLPTVFCSEMNSLLPFGMTDASRRRVKFVRFFRRLLTVRVIGLCVFVFFLLPSFVVASFPLPRVPVHVPSRNDADVRRLESPFLSFAFVLRLHDVQPIKLQKYDQCVLASEEYVHVANDTIVYDQNQSERKERAILE